MTQTSPAPAVSAPASSPSSGSPNDPVGALVPGRPLHLPGAASGPLHGLTFGLKDLFDVAGEVAGFGNPDWLASHPPAISHAPTLRDLLAAGASCVGRTITVELAAGLTGENPWYGTPRNPAAPDRLPGGSSAGSAAGTAAGMFDFALGSDTAGSIRIPASYCGLHGLRPTWGLVSLMGTCPLGPSFDTVGWLSRDAATLARVGDILLPPQAPRQLGPLLRPLSAWSNADPSVVAALEPLLARLESLLGPALPIEPNPEGLSPLYDGFRAMAAEENVSALGAWVAATRPRLAPNVSQRFADAPRQDPALGQAARALRSRLTARLDALLAGGAVLVFPTSPVPAPRRDAPPSEIQSVRERTIAVTSLSGFAGLPELTVPGALADGAPVGLSLMAARGSDRALLALAEAMA